MRLINKPRIISNSKVAVILACYNGVNWLEEQILSIQKQNNIAITIFINVDLSTDGTEKLVEQIIKKNKNIYALPFGKKFGCAAANFFELILKVNFEKYDFVALSDQDDVWHPKKIYRALSILRQNNAEAYSSNVEAFWENYKKKKINKSQKQKKWDFLFESAGPGCTFVLSKSLALNLKQFIFKNQKVIKRVKMHDWFIYAYARSNGYLWVIDNFYSVSYRQHTGNEIGVNSGFRALIYRINKVKSGWALNQSILIINLLGMQNLLFIKKWIFLNRIGFLKLAFCSFNCRRKLLDVFIFFVVCIYYAIFGINIK